MPLSAENRSPRYSPRAAGQFVTHSAQGQHTDRRRIMVSCRAWVDVVGGVAKHERWALTARPTNHQNYNRPAPLLEAPRIMCVLIGLLDTPRGPNEQPSARETSENRYCFAASQDFSIRSASHVCATPYIPYPHIIRLRTHVYHGRPSWASELSYLILCLCPGDSFC